MEPLVVPRHADTLSAIGGPLRLAAKYDMAGVTRALVPVLDEPAEMCDILQILLVVSSFIRS